MLRFQWNALRVGDRVLVHDDDDLAVELTEGTVTHVQPRAGSSGNNVAIRTAAKLMRPRRTAVHTDQADSNGDCWRCDAFHDAHLSRVVYMPPH